MLPTGTEWSMQVTLGNLMVMLSVISTTIPIIALLVHIVVSRNRYTEWLEQLWMSYADEHGIPVERKLRDKYSTRNGYHKKDDSV